MLKSLKIFRILGVDDLPARISIYDRTVDIVFLEHKAGEITSNVYPDFNDRYSMYMFKSWTKCLTYN